MIEPAQKETIHVVDRKNALWVNVSHADRVILICEEGIHGEIESVGVRPEDIEALISALSQASEMLPKAPETARE